MAVRVLYEVETPDEGVAFVTDLMKDGTIVEFIPTNSGDGFRLNVEESIDLADAIYFAIKRANLATQSGA